ncbi:anti-sigma regulatory factor [Streptomyces sp. 549]|uniref:anti-sigma regulatory factor n=1 Tax=Streptomyces sp. 549 TaxID=3049076 RepID=UPI0024C287C7|nr:anti-sigma regulatory factor [Streptomyces sp. 549]MDK1471965.1 anti-sigma regulatory factor [Streptomyces sp. 549]
MKNPDENTAGFTRDADTAAHSRTTTGTRTITAAAGPGRGSAQAGSTAGTGRTATHAVRSEEDLLTVRHAVRNAALRVGFGIVDQTRVVTAASELARNAYIHGGGGTLTLEQLEQPGHRGLRMTTSDDGPGIPDVAAALTDGYTTGAGLGHGLGGVRRLMDEFEIHSVPGKGTTIRATRWTSR